MVSGADVGREFLDSSGPAPKILCIKFKQEFTVSFPVLVGRFIVTRDRSITRTRFLCEY
jgi:hypothetical protein